MQKMQKQLTEDQKARKVIFSSCLSTKRSEEAGGLVHEVLVTDEDKSKTIERLLNDRFFNKSPYKYNIVRQ